MFWFEINAFNYVFIIAVNHLILITFNLKKHV